MSLCCGDTKWELHETNRDRGLNATPSSLQLQHTNLKRVQRDFRFTNIQPEPNIFNMEDHGYGSLFDFPKPTKKWQKPEAHKEYVNSPRSNTDWLGGSCVETNSPTRRSTKVENWMGSGVGESSPCRGARPGQVKIEGYRSSIKDNPFLKK